jgi:hypothetical protein
MIDMKTKAQKIWNTYKEGYSEALCTPVEQFDTSMDSYSRKIVADVIRDISSELQYYNFGEGADMIIDAQALYELADELEELK